MEEEARREDSGLNAVMEACNDGNADANARECSMKDGSQRQREPQQIADAVTIGSSGR